MQRFNHACEINFEILSSNREGVDITGSMVRAAVTKFLADRTDEELLTDFNIFDTIEEGA